MGPQSRRTTRVAELQATLPQVRTTENWRLGSKPAYVGDSFCLSPCHKRDGVASLNSGARAGKPGSRRLDACQTEDPIFSSRMLNVVSLNHVEILPICSQILIATVPK